MNTIPAGFVNIILADCVNTAPYQAQDDLSDCSAAPSNSFERMASVRQMQLPTYTSPYSSLPSGGSAPNNSPWIPGSQTEALYNPYEVFPPSITLDSQPSPYINCCGDLEQNGHGNGHEGEEYTKNAQDTIESTYLYVRVEQSEYG